ncbi:hypothetical protein K0A97_03315 [Patescibacteria group bacterium]|nr:hypothetical protein [Patescibacteria group bacterium]
MGKLQTPDWIREGYDSKADWEKSKGVNDKKKSKKNFKIKICPKCKDTDVKVILGNEEGKGSQGWECLKCKWKGKSPEEKELSEEEFLEYLEKEEK